VPAQLPDGKVDESPRHNDMVSEDEDLVVVQPKKIAVSEDAKVC